MRALKLTEILMGIYDRDYMGSRQSYGSYGMTMVQKLLLANIAVFVFVFGTGFGSNIGGALLMQPNAVLDGEVWRLFTATYMHASFWGHLFFNMLALYFFGPVVERVWGARKFFLVYTACGVAGNVALVLLSQVGYISPMMYGLGASGSVLGVLGAAAVMFPHAQILLFFVIPMTLRVAALLFTGIYIFNIVSQGSNYGGDISHLVGMGIGAAIAAKGK